MPRHRRKDPPKNGTGPNPKTGAESHPKNRAGPRQKNGARSSNKNGAGSRPENGAGRHLKNGAGPRPKRRARPTRKQRACRSIDKLPAEVLLQILSDHSIDKDDLKTLRCTSKLFYNVSTELLFRRICISEIWQDTNSFFAIANTPHLAVNVQTVAWTEISGRPAELCTSAELGEESGTLFLNLRDQAVKKLFWWPLVEVWTLQWHKQHKQTSAQRRIYDQFLPAFLSALDLLPNLRCLVLEPMHPCREINGAVGQRYSLTPQLLQSEFVIGNALSCATPSNLAFYRFLLPAMQHLANNRNPSTAARPFITRLTLRDPGHSAIDFLGNSPMNPDPSLFRDLTRLDVDLDGHSFCRFRNGPEMLQSLAGARNLTHLSLQFKSETIPGTSSPSQDKNLRYEFLRDWPTFPRLEYLRVDAHEDPGGSLVAFVAKHAKTLVRLQLDIFDANEDLWTDLHTVAPDLEIYTHVDGDDEEPWATEAYRWRGDFRVPMNTSGPSIRRTHNHGVPLRPPETCDVRDPIEEAQKRESPMGSLDFDPVDPTWPGELVGLYEPLDGDLNMEQRIRTEMTEGKPMWPKDADKRIAYATEEISFLRKRGLLYGSDGVRLNPAPRWYFARDHNGQMLFRQTHPEHEIGGFPTENWLFTHHSGTQACGDDPLEYFADWEGSEAGDVQEPTPFGTQITKAGWEWPAGRGMEEEMERGTRLAQLGVEYVPMEIYREEYYPIDPSMHVAPAEGSEDGEEHEDEDDDDDYDGDSEEEDEQEAEEEWYEDSEDEEHDHHMEGQ